MDLGGPCGTGVLAWGALVVELGVREVCLMLVSRGVGLGHFTD